VTAGWKRLIVDIAAVVLPGDRMVFGGDILGALVRISAPGRVPDHVMPGSCIAADKLLRPANTPKDSKAEAPGRLFLAAI
jgi:hypothetical protein